MTASPPKPTHTFAEIPEDRDHPRQSVGHGPVRRLVTIDGRGAVSARIEHYGTVWAVKEEEMVGLRDIEVRVEKARVAVINCSREYGLPVLLRDRAGEWPYEVSPRHMAIVEFTENPDSSEPRP